MSSGPIVITLCSPMDAAHLVRGDVITIAGKRLVIVRRVGQDQFEIRRTFGQWMKDGWAAFVGWWRARLHRWW